MTIDFHAIAESIRESGAQWTAGETSMTALPDDANRRERLGYFPGSGELTLQERELLSAENLRNAGSGESSSAPASVDWRSMNGASFVSSVKDQGNCGSCVAFGVAAAMDSAMRITRELPVHGPNSAMLADVSEAHLFYGSGRKCASGWNIGGALGFAADTGVVPDYVYPYTAGDQSCNLPGDWKKYVTKLSQYHYVRTASDMKNWLSSKGPLITAFAVYKDFFSYKDGVYSHVWGEYAGAHCVCVIGYDDTKQAWLCKNSWGTDWGQGGYFSIAYGQCGIDAGMWAIDSFSTVYPDAGSSDWLTLVHQGWGANGEVWRTKLDRSGVSTPDRKGANIGISSGPGLAVFKDQLYLAHQGWGDNGELWYTVCDGDWAADQRVPNVGMSASPALAVFNGRLYLAHQGWGANGELWYTSFDGSSWAADQRVPNVGMSDGPGLVVWY
jgi:C1A family cysteine protease